MPTTGPQSGRRRPVAASEKADPTAVESTPAGSGRGDRSAKKGTAKKTTAKKASKKTVAKEATVGKATKKPPAKKATTKKAVAKKSTKKPTKKATTKKAVAKKAVAKKPAKKATSKEPEAKEAVAKKATTKKAVAKKVVAKKPAKKATTRKAVARKSTARRSVKKSGKKSTTTKPTARKSADIRKTSTAGKATKKSTRKATAKRRSGKHKPTTITRRVSRKRPPRRARAAKSLIGWREWVVLPEFTGTPIKAKVDSGAVTSSLHAFNLQINTDGGQTTARFGVAPKQGSHAAKTIVEHPVVAFKKVRSSNGQAELRPVIRTVAVIGAESFEIDITLASRDAMGFRMLLGRKAVRNRFVIDPGRSFLQPTTPDGVPPADQEKKQG